MNGRTLIFIRLFFFSVIFFSTLTFYSQDTKVGTNLAGIVDWSPEFVFKDIFKSARTWTSYNADGGGPWDTQVDIPLREDGYPLQIPYDNGVNPPQAVKALILWDLQYGYPTGDYTLKLKGTGTVKLSFGASGTYQAPGTYTFTPNGTLGIAVELLSSDVNDPVHGIEIIMPGFEDNYESNPFHPEFLDFIADFKVLRYMDFMRTNNSPVVSWNDRTPLNYYTQAVRSGIAYEYMVDIANTAQKDIWVCVPHQATDAYITQLATFLHQNLNSGLKVYIEYSNEVWNGIFAQHQYAADQGSALGYSGQNWERAWKYYAKRSADIFYLFEQVYGQNSNNLVKVIASQASNNWISNYILTRFEEASYNPNGVTADVLAIAPYFGGEVGDNIGNEGLIESITVNEILNRLDASMETAKGWINEQKAVASAHGLELAAYEGGQHLVAYNYLNNETLTQKLTDANRHARMENIYCEYLNYWYDNVPNGLFANFSSISAFTKWGSWGIKEYTGQPDEDAPKYLAFKNCVFNANILPIGLNKFDVNVTNENDVSLVWQTASEVNNRGFYVERSSDGQEFEYIGFVEGNDNSNEIINYKFNDYDLFSGIYYYRLKQIDFNDTYKYSEIRSATIKNPESVILFVPNPAQSYTKLYVDIKEKMYVDVQIIDMTGRLKEKIKLNLNTGKQGVKINLDNYEKGVYIVKVTLNNTTYINKLIVNAL